MTVLQFLGGIALLLLSAEAFIRGAVALAAMLRTPPLVIGMTVVAIGTSVPELVVTLDATLAGSTGLAVGNVVGSNLFNILGIAGLAAVVTPLPVPARIHDVDNWVMLGTAVLMLPILTGRWRPGRPAASLFLVLYAAYVWSSLLVAG